MSSNFRLRLLRIKDNYVLCTMNIFYNIFLMSDVIPEQKNPDNQSAEDGQVNNMKELFRQASTASNSSPGNQKELLVRHINEILLLVSHEHKKNIMAAASRGDKQAIITIYRMGIKHRNKIPINDLLFPPPHLTQTYHDLLIKNLLCHLEEKFAPFGLSIVPIPDLLQEFRSRGLLKEDPSKEVPDFSEFEEFKAIVVEWE